MTRRNKRLVVEFAVALAVCGAIAALDRVAIGLAGAALCVVVFAARAFLIPPFDDMPRAEVEEDAADPVRKPEHIVTGLVPYRYNFGNPIHYPHDDSSDSQGR
jgi:hypothetical protein